MERTGRERTTISKVGGEGPPLTKTLGGMTVPALKIGETYYMLQYPDRKGSPPIVSSYVYKGTVDGKPNRHYFKALGLSDNNVFLDAPQLGTMVDFNGLRKALQVQAHAS